VLKTLPYGEGFDATTPLDNKDIVVMSTLEAEYIACSEASRDDRWLLLLCNNVKHNRNDENDEDENKPLPIPVFETGRASPRAFRPALRRPGRAGNLKAHKARAF
jgi:hypothetical protein